MLDPAAIPKLGLGTYGRTGDAGTEAILAALSIGYRHLDTAQSYNTESTVGEAWRRSRLPRDEVFITTKVADTNLEKDQVLPSVEKSLETIGVDRVDLLLIHWPSHRDAVPFEDYMLALAEAKEKGFARLVGVSNFNIDLLKRATALLGPGAVATNQVEIHPYLQAPKLRDFAREERLMLTAYLPLAKGVVGKDPEIRRIAERHVTNASAVALAFLMAEGHVVIPASGNPANLEANFAAASLKLDEDDMRAMRGLDRGERRIDPEKAPPWDD